VPHSLRAYKKLEKVDFHELRGWKVIRSATVDFNGVELNIGMHTGWGMPAKLLDEVKEGKSKFHAIEVMACPGGCIGGGGQPFNHGDSENPREARAALYMADHEMPIRKSHENPSIIKLYEDSWANRGASLLTSCCTRRYFPKSNEVTIHLQG